MFGLMTTLLITTSRKPLSRLLGILPAVAGAALVAYAIASGGYLGSVIN
jgi:hypothetical protein